MAEQRPQIALFGANGQVGWELQRSLQPLGKVIAFNRDAAPLHDLARLQAVLDQLDAQVLVNAAAYTAVDKAESEPTLAQTVNAEAVALMATWAKKRQALLIHYSTDYVFDGSGEHFRSEDAATAPLSVYGASKLAGEAALESSGCAYMCFRTSWVYAARGGNFAKTMLRLAAERDALKVVGDQWGAPTGADLIADVTAHALQKHLIAASQAVLNEKSDQRPSICYSDSYKNGSDAMGVFHLVAAGQTNWHAYASLVIERARARGAAIQVSVDAIQAIPSSAYATPAQRPLNSRLSCDRLEKSFGLKMPHWQTGVERLVDMVT